MAKIMWAGHSCFQISFSSAKNTNCNVVTDPFGDIGLKEPNFEADAVLTSHNHYDHNNIKAVKGNPFLINGPGEYEVKGIFIQGIDSFHDDVEGKERGRNTIYIIEGENMRFCHMGDFGQKQLTDEQLEKLGKIDVLMIPVGGTYTVDSHGASKITGQIEPRVVIPMHCDLPKLKIKLDGVDKFLRAMGKNSIESQDKLVLKPSSLPKEGAMEIVALKP